jgi:hypothetical protein
MSDVERLRNFEANVIARKAMTPDLQIGVGRNTARRLWESHGILRRLVQSANNAGLAIEVNTAGLPRLRWRSLAPRAKVAREAPHARRAADLRGLWLHGPTDRPGVRTGGLEAHARRS